MKRRFDRLVEEKGLAYIDDYAHHPNEIAASISSIKGYYPGARYTAIFQPHLYTRTRDFADEFAQALSNADRLILLDIYPAREEPIPGVTSSMIFDKVTAPEKVLIKKEELASCLENMDMGDNEVFITLGAGDIDRLTGDVAGILRKKHGNR